MVPKFCVVSFLLPWYQKIYSWLQLKKVCVSMEIVIMGLTVFIILKGVWSSGTVLFSQNQFDCTILKKNLILIWVIKIIPILSENGQFELILRCLVDWNWVWNTAISCLLKCDRTCSIWYFSQNFPSLGHLVCCYGRSSHWASCRTPGWVTRRSSSLWRRERGWTLPGTVLSLCKIASYACRFNRCWLILNGPTN